MRKRIRTAMKTTLRSAFKTVHLLKRYYTLKDISPDSIKDPCFFLALETGMFTNLAGCRSMLENFLQNSNLGSYSGDSEVPRKPSDKDFSKSKLRIVPFDHTFTFLPIDINKCMK